MKQYIIALVSFYLLTTQCMNAQQNTTIKSNIIHEYSKIQTVELRNVHDEWFVKVENQEPLREGNKSYADYLRQIKKEIAQKYPPISKHTYLKNDSDSNSLAPFMLRSFEGNLMTGNIPNDNTLAISNNNLLVSAINSILNIYNVAQDTLLKTTTLAAFCDTLHLDPDKYDPKLLYDPQEDKFVITYLSGFDDSTSNIVVGFSESNDPMGFWHFYSLPGNPLDDTSWTDYPAIAFTNNELFISCNLLCNGGTWQTSFKRSVIWQLDKFAGYTGQATIPTKLWDSVFFNEKPIRNICPIQGGDHLLGPDIFLLSNRNFAIQNDSIFIVHVSNVLSSPSAELTVNLIKADKSYGVPPDARQTTSHRLATNDARILGGFYQNGMIQFVANTIDTNTGFAAVYHGIISNPSDTTLHGVIISDSILDYGYPNISYLGNNSGNNQAMITFNHTGPSTYPGFSAVSFNATDCYSPRVLLKEGLIYVSLISGVERWGDYSGSQRKYNEPGKVWTVGSFGRYRKLGYYNYKANGTWIAELIASDSVSGISDHFPSSSSIVVFPNPTNDFISINFTTSKKTNVNIALFDLSGRLVKQLYNNIAKAGLNNISFATKPLKSGVYILQIKEGNNIISAEKVIVN